MSVLVRPSPSLCEPPQPRMRCQSPAAKFLLGMEKSTSPLNAEEPQELVLGGISSGPPPSGNPLPGPVDALVVKPSELTCLQRFCWLAFGMGGALNIVCGIPCIFETIFK